MTAEQVLQEMEEHGLETLGLVNSVMIFSLADGLELVVFFEEGERTASLRQKYKQNYYTYQWPFISGDFSLANVFPRDSMYDNKSRLSFKEMLFYLKRVLT